MLVTYFSINALSSVVRDPNAGVYHGTFNWVLIKEAFHSPYNNGLSFSSTLLAEVQN